ncbi:WYL domain-containing protein, partial [bacterium]|nr:WYL domain-containing protein [bacterium]
YRTYAGGNEANLTDAIQRRQPVTFYYDDKWQEDGVPGKAGQRIGNPHAIWVGSNGTKYLHLYVDPQSASATGSLPGWRTFILSRIQNVSVLELGSSFFGRKVEFVQAPGFNRAWYSRVGTPVVLLK